MGAHLSVSYTSREPREGELDGREYHFITPEEFEEMIGRNEFVEWAKFPPEDQQGDYYGTAKAEVERSGTTFLEIEIQGARRMQLLYPNATIVFIVPPSMEALRRRLEGRGDVSPEKMESRLARATVEMLEGPLLTGHVIVNEDGEEGLQRAVDQLVSLL